MLLKIGELARRTGLTVRTLHHYDAISLLRPSARSDAGYRLYNHDDVSRLHRIQALRRLDLSLAEIAGLLEGGTANLESVIEQQIVALDRQQVRTAVLRDRLGVLLARVRANVEPDLPDWLSTLELMAVHDRYFTSDDLNTLRLLRQNLGEDRQRKSIALIRSIRALMLRGVAPESEEARALSSCWRAMVHQSMGGDPRLILKLDAMHRRESAAQTQTGVDGALIDYMSAAAAAHRLTIYAKYLNADEMKVMRARHGRNARAWIALFADVRECMERGVVADSREGQSLCGRWLALARAEWGDDPSIAEKIRAVHAAEPEMMTGIGISPEMTAYLESGIAHLTSNRPSPETDHADA